MYFLPLILVFFASVGGLLFPDKLDHFWFVPFLLSALFLGLPHGAADWSVLKTTVHKRGWRRSTPLLLGYTFLLILAGTITLAFPLIGLILFLAVSAWHFGSADAHDFAQHFGLTPSPGALATQSLVRGTLIVAAPFAFRIEDMFWACQRWCGILEASWLPEEMMPALQTGARFLLFYALLAAAGQILRAGARASWRSGACLLAEVVLIVTLFACLPPLFALGTYFLCWHSLRHLSHLLPFRSRGAQVGWLYRLSGPFLIPSLAAIGFFAFLTGHLSSPADLTVILIIFFAIVTPAHQWLIHREVHPS